VPLGQVTMREPLYTLEQVTVRRDGRLVLTVERLALGQGRLTALFGPNGAGKSTLLRLLALYTRPDSGTLTFLGRSWDEVDRATRRQVVFLPQHPFLLDGSVLANVAYGLRIRGVRRHLDRRAAEALAWVGLPEAFLHRSVHTLSGGERQRVALAARLVLRPRVLLLDEPTASVDLESAQHIRRAMLMAGGRWGATLVVSSHDHNWLRPMAEAQIMLFRGRVMDSGQVNILFGPWRMEDGMACTRWPAGDGCACPAGKASAVQQWPWWIQRRAWGRRRSGNRTWPDGSRPSGRPGSRTCSNWSWSQERWCSGWCGRRPRCGGAAGFLATGWACAFSPAASASSPEASAAGRARRCQAAQSLAREPGASLEKGCCLLCAPQVSKKTRSSSASRGSQPACSSSGRSGKWETNPMHR